MRRRDRGTAAAEPSRDAVPFGKARVRPQDIDSVPMGLPALLRRTAFNQRPTPMVAGEVVHAAAKDGRERPPRRTASQAARRRAASQLASAIAPAVARQSGRPPTW